MTLANKITIFRLFTIPVFVALIYQYTPERDWLRYAALGVYVVAAISDGLDGYIARHYNQMTQLGMRLDPLADKLVINLGFVFMAANPNFNPHVPLWLPVLILFRDVSIVVGALIINKKARPDEIKPRWTGKITTVLQLCTLIGLLVHVPFFNFLIWATVIVTFVSGFDYLYAAIRRTLRQDPV